MKKQQLLLLLLLLLLIFFFTFRSELLDLESAVVADVTYGTATKEEAITEQETNLVESTSDKEVDKAVIRIISWEDGRDEHMYIAEVESEKIKRFIEVIAESEDLSAAEKEFTISAIRYSENCPLECLDGYSKYKKEFETNNPSGYDVENYTFEELINKHASFAKNVREELGK